MRVEIFEGKDLLFFYLQRFIYVEIDNSQGRIIGWRIDKDFSMLVKSFYNEAFKVQYTRGI